MSIHWRSLKTSDKIEAIRSVWNPGMSARQVAAHFNGASRNSIIGVYHRYAAELAELPLLTPSKLMRSERQRRERKERHGPLVSLKPPATHALPEAQMFADEAHLCGKPLVMLRAKECKWPVNEAEQGGLHLFCARPSEGSYCTHHAGRVKARHQGTVG